jgi:hypothetical protein
MNRQYYSFNIIFSYNISLAAFLFYFLYHLIYLSTLYFKVISHQEFSVMFGCPFRALFEHLKKKNLYLSTLYFKVISHQEFSVMFGFPFRALFEHLKKKNPCML